MKKKLIGLMLNLEDSCLSVIIEKGPITQLRKPINPPETNADGAVTQDMTNITQATMDYE